MGITVEGVKINDDQIAEVGMAMRGHSEFTYNAVQESFFAAGVPLNACYRAADRWLQMQKKSGLIFFSAKKWRWML